jgi:hypothetical protein
MIGGLRQREEIAKPLPLGTVQTERSWLIACAAAEHQQEIVDQVLPGAHSGRISWMALFIWSV